MKQFNFSLVEGNLTGDPVITPDGVCNFTITACEGTKFFDISCKSKLGENCYKYLKKGSRVLVSGKIQNTHVSMEGREINFLTRGSK